MAYKRTTKTSGGVRTTTTRKSTGTGTHQSSRSTSYKTGKSGSRYTTTYKNDGSVKHTKTQPLGNGYYKTTSETLNKPAKPARTRKSKSASPSFASMLKKQSRQKKSSGGSIYTIIGWGIILMVVAAIFGK